MSINLPVVEFYITNVCNLTCRGCNRFNNHNFKGHHYWKDHAELYEAWSNRINIDKISIIGGEPTLNPDLESWVSNLRRLWPNADMMIQTNGTYIRPYFVNFWKKYKVNFVISLHDINTAEQIMQDWKKLLGNWFTTFLKGFVFHQSSLIQENNHFTLNRNVPEMAFGCCDMKYDHTMVNGKLYKCPMTAILPSFDNQFHLQLDSKQKELLYSYTPLLPTCSEQDLIDFFQQRNTAIKQCEFCFIDPTWDRAIGPSSPNSTIPEFDGITLKEIPFYKILLT